MTTSPAVNSIVRFTSGFLALLAILAVIVFSPIIIPICRIHDYFEDRRRKKRMEDARLWAS